MYYIVYIYSIYICFNHIMEKAMAPTPVFWPGEFHGLHSPWVTKNGTRLSDFHFHSIHLLFAIDSKLLQRMDLCVPHVTYI